MLAVGENALNVLIPEFLGEVVVYTASIMALIATFRGHFTFFTVFCAWISIVGGCLALWVTLELMEYWSSIDFLMSLFPLVAGCLAIARMRRTKR